MEIAIAKGSLLAPVARGDWRTKAVESALEGRRRWLKSGVLSLEDTPANRAALLRAYPRAVIASPFLAERVAGGRRRGAPSRPTYRRGTKPYGHQDRCLHKMRKAREIRRRAGSAGSVFAIFAEQGTGKTWNAIDWAGELFAAGDIDAVLVISKKGPHSQWIDEQIPIHYAMKHKSEFYTGRRKQFVGADDDTLHFFSINIDALKNEKGWSAALTFVKLYDKRVLIVIDESHLIKNHKSARTKRAYALGDMVEHKMILTGTPIAKNLCDEWSQFKFLDEAIIGYRYITSFRHQYCVMGGWENRDVVGVKNMDEFLKKVEPFSFRVTKEEELDLPPKVYDTVAFEMNDEQRGHYDAIKEMFLTQLDSGEIATVANAAVAITRLQEVTSGIIEGRLPRTQDDVLQKRKGKIVSQEIKDNPRLDALCDLLEQRRGKAVIWARFNYDIEQIIKRLGKKAVAYYGQTSARDRDEAKRRWLDPRSEIDYLVASPSAAGTGLNLQGDCRTVVYYSNSFNAIDRWQSEDRTHRIGTKGTVTYFDLVCRGTVDRKILANLKKKKSLSDLALGGIKSIIIGEDDDDGEPAVVTKRPGRAAPAKAEKRSSVREVGAKPTAPIRGESKFGKAFRRAA